MSTRDQEEAVSDRFFEDPDYQPEYVFASDSDTAIRMTEVTTLRRSDECLDCQRTYNLYMAIRRAVLHAAAAEEIDAAAAAMVEM